ncbi:MAG: hypothetical protein SFV15_04205 [Polyangiaceae bacterium]|nr:hypothetical protein [Polyangiaceae bacterium]
MRDAVRQILRIVPLLFVVSITAFALVSVGLGERVKPEVTNELPLFANLKPVDVRAVSLELMNAIAQKRADRGAERRLVELGSAAFPFVLPSLDALNPNGRELVARALLPVAQRMGIWEQADAEQKASLPQFWQRYWQDRAIDFRPVVVKRLTERLAEHDSPLSERELIQLDTYCLNELLLRLRSIRTAGDIKRAERLLRVAAHVADKDWVVPPNADLATTRSIVKKWQDWWPSARSRFMPLDGPLRVVALVAETQYGKWLGALLRNGMGNDVHGEALARRLWRATPTTLGLILPSLLFAHVLGPRLASWLRRLPQRLRLALLSLWFLPVALPFVAMFDPRERQPGGFAGALFLMLIWVMAPVVWQELAAQTKAQELPASFRVGHPQHSPKMLFGMELPAVLSLSVLLELLFGLEGVGRIVAEALHAGDRNQLVLLALLGTLCSSLLRIASDLAIKRSRRVARLLIVRDSSADVTL